MKKKNYLIAFFAPWLIMLFSAALGTCGHDVSARTYTDSICMFMLTWLLLRRFTQERQQIIRMTATMIVGYLVIMSPLYLDFTHEYFAQTDLFIVIVSMILAAVCFKTQRISVLVLSVILLILLNTYGVHAWIDLMKP